MQAVKRIKACSQQSRDSLRTGSPDYNRVPVFEHKKGGPPV